MSVSSEPAARIREIMAEILDVDPARIDGTFSREDSPAWDSLAHLRLITALEEAFGVKLTMREVGEMDRYEKIRERLASRSAP